MNRNKNKNIDQIPSSYSEALCNGRCLSAPKNVSANEGQVSGKLFIPNEEWQPNVISKQSVHKGEAKGKRWKKFKGHWPPEVCKYYNNIHGCRFKNRCKFKHIRLPQKKENICWYYTQGFCRFQSACWNLHPKQKSEHKKMDISTRVKVLEQELAKAWRIIEKTQKMSQFQKVLLEEDSLQQQVHSHEEDFVVQNQSLKQELASLVTANKKIDEDIKDPKSASPGPIEVSANAVAFKKQISSELLEETIEGSKIQTEGKQTPEEEADKQKEKSMENTGSFVQLQNELEVNFGKNEIALRNIIKKQSNDIKMLNEELQRLWTQVNHAQMTLSKLKEKSSHEISSLKQQLQMANLKLQETPTDKLKELQATKMCPQSKTDQLKNKHWLKNNNRMKAEANASYKTGNLNVAKRSLENKQVKLNETGEVLSHTESVKEISSTSQTGKIQETFSNSLTTEQIRNLTVQKILSVPNPPNDFWAELKQAYQKKFTEQYGKK